MFLEVIDPINGQRTWKTADENYDMAQEIARSNYADMIHDTERNKFYELGLHSVITKTKQENKSVHVVDIGTGTGLLSMMAVCAGADRVTALETFQPMANCCRSILERNGFGDRIKVIASRSTELTERGYSDKANVIVAEVFDTELIGEGALRTFKEALKTFAMDSCRVIPSSARVWIAPVQSETLMKFHRAPSNSMHQIFTNCPGAAAVHDIQLSELSQNDIKLLADPFVAFRFNFEESTSIKYNESLVETVFINARGKFEAVIMWWDLDMDGSGQYILSMAPKWFDEKAEWRDHWMQAVYYLPKSISVENEQKISLRCSHDEFSFWFSVESDDIYAKKDPPHCECKMHAICSRNNIYRMNDLDSDNDFDQLLEKLCLHKSVLCINEGSLVGLRAGKYAENVTIVEPNSHFRSILSTCLIKSPIENRVQVISDEYKLPVANVDVILSEPFWLSSFLPWHNLHFWFKAQNIAKRLNHNVEISPKTSVMYALPVRLQHLWKIAAPVGTVSGFDLSPFDEICQKARSATDAIIEPHPLWEYPSIVTGYPIPVASFDFESALPTGVVSSTTKVKPTRSGTNAIVFWMDWCHEGYIMKTGLLESCVIGERPRWSMSYRQGVFFYPESQRTNIELRNVSVNVKFDPSDAQIFFHLSFDD